MLTPTSDIDSCLAVRELGSVVRVRVRVRIGLSIHKQLARHEYIIPYTSIEFDHSTIGILRNMSYGGRLVGIQSGRQVYHAQRVPCNACN